MSFLLNLFGLINFEVTASHQNNICSSFLNKEVMLSVILLHALLYPQHHELWGDNI
jgi:cytochrome b561